MEDQYLDSYFESRNECFEDLNHNWPGDGSGEDDFADYNQNESDDYSDE